MSSLTTSTDTKTLIQVIHPYFRTNNDRSIDGWMDGWMLVGDADDDDGAGAGAGAGDDM